MQFGLTLNVLGNQMLLFIPVFPCPIQVCGRGLKLATGLLQVLLGLNQVLLGLKQFLFGLSKQLVQLEINEKFYH